MQAEKRVTEVKTLRIQRNLRAKWLHLSSVTEEHGEVQRQDLMWPMGSPEGVGETQGDAGGSQRPRR